MSVGRTRIKEQILHYERSLSPERTKAPGHYLILHVGHHKKYCDSSIYTEAMIQVASPQIKKTFHLNIIFPVKIKLTEFSIRSAPPR